MDRREEILEHASRVLIREGRERMSLRRIAREGGFTTGVLTHHFVDKRELVTACFRWTMARWLDAAEHELEAAESDERHVERFVRIAVPAEERRHGEWRLWFELCAEAVRDADAAEALVHADARWEALIADSVDRWREAGLLPEETDPRETALLLARLIDGLCLRALVNGTWDEARRRLADNLVALGLPDDLAARAGRPR